MRHISEVIEFEGPEGERRQWARAASSLMKRISKVGSAQALREELAAPQLDDPDWVDGIASLVAGTDPPPIRLDFEDITYSCHECKDVLYVPAPDVIRNGMAYSQVRKCSGGFCPAWKKHREKTANPGKDEEGAIL